MIVKCQAAAILSVNDSWGVFSRSRISLLPHQLWVCHRVLRRWPIRYLVADDVGLGKTIEAGLILWPLISKGHQQKVLSYFDIAREEGATFVTGGGVPSFDDDRDNGCFVQPTILCDLTDESRFNREEVFGPVCHVSPFDSEDEVVERVNNTDYGLAACIWTQK